MPRHPSWEDRDADLAPLAPVAMVLGVAMAVTALAAASRIPNWTADYGVMVIAVGTLYLAVAAGLVYWGLQLRHRTGND